MTLRLQGFDSRPISLLNLSMLDRLRFLGGLVAAVFILQGCVSIGFQGSAQQAKGLRFEAPPAPFQPLQDSAFDRAWVSQSTRSVISFKSECGIAATSTERILGDLAQVISSLQILEEVTQPIDHRTAQTVKVQGQYEGRGVKLKLVHYRKSQCNFLISLQAAQSHFEKDLPIFNQFLQSFKSP